MDNIAKEQNFFRYKTVLITGATGFVAKVLVEKILRVQPDLTKLYLLLRVNETMSLNERLHSQIMKKDVFSVLRRKQGDKFDSFISEKVAPIAGDTSLSDLGIISNEIRKEIDAIIHVAATTKFHERYDFALGTNTFGAMNVINFAKRCSRLQILVHVSTGPSCYVSGLCAKQIYEAHVIRWRSCRGKKLL